MPLYRGTINKKAIFPFAGEEWSNVYTISTGNVTEAMGVLNAIQLNEQAVSYFHAQFTTGKVVNIADPTDRATTTYGSLGDLDPTELGGPLPLFCTVLVTFTDNVKKPEQKYLRLFANKANLADGAWSPEFVAFVQSNYADQLLLQLPFVGPSGEDHTSALVHTAVQNRQLGWHRRTRPGFHRGWVPN